MSPNKYILFAVQFIHCLRIAIKTVCIFYKYTIIKNHGDSADSNPVEKIISLPLFIVNLNQLLIFGRSYAIFQTVLAKCIVSYYPICDVCHELNNEGFWLFRNSGGVRGYCGCTQHKFSRNMCHETRLKPLLLIQIWGSLYEIPKSRFFVR